VAGGADLVCVVRDHGAGRAGDQDRCDRDRGQDGFRAHTTHICRVA